MPQYAVIRTNRDEREYIWSEFEKGRLRQGWGWLDRQDLRILMAKRDRGDQLDDAEKSAWRNRRMLAETWNGLQVGDVVLSPNLPDPGKWVAMRVSGPYEYEKKDEGDYRHILPVEPVRLEDGAVAVIDPGSPVVDARLRGTMRTMSRLWSIDHLAEAVKELIAIIESGGDVSTGQSWDERRESFLAEIQGDIASLAWTRLAQRYRGAELEDLLVPVLESAYGKGTVRRHGGAGEHGADLVVTKEGPMGLTFKTAIQVKMYDGVLDDLHPVEQLRVARERRQVQACVLLTTATEISERVAVALDELGHEVGIDIQAWTRDDVVRLLLAHLGRRDP